jgi:6-phosphogluconolactonase
MKFNTMVRTGVAAATSLAAALGISACSRDYTAAYVYSISSSTGNISGYGVDYQSGVLTQLQGSPFTTQFTNPVTILSTPNGKFVYAISGNQQAAVEPFSVGTDGKIYGEATVNITGTYPTAAAIDSTSTYLFVTYRYQTPYSPASPGPGGVSIFKINADGTLGTPANVNVGNNPVAITVTDPVCTTAPLAGSLASACTSPQSGNVFVYVVDQETAGGQLVNFSLNNATGALAPLAGVSCTGTPTACSGTTAIGIKPSAIAADPTGRYLYVTDQTLNEIFGFAIGSSAGTATAGQLKSLVSSPYTTGLFPVSITIDPRGKYVYTANFNGSSVSSYSLTSADGSLGGTASVGNFSTHTGPTCVTIEPALGIYLYTSNNLDSTIDGGQLSPNTGQLSSVPDTPFPSGPLPSCLTSVPNGPRANQLVFP